MRLQVGGRAARDCCTISDKLTQPGGRPSHIPFATLAGENISARFVVPTVATSLDLVVHLGIDAQGVRRVNEIVAVPGRVENDIIETESVFERTGGELRRGSGMPPRLDLFDRAGIDVRSLINESR